MIEDSFSPSKSPSGKLKGLKVAGGKPCCPPVSGQYIPMFERVAQFLPQGDSQAKFLLIVVC
jgi:hypothetical protein